MSVTVGSLFAGVGGIDLGLERAGMRIAWQVEIDPYCIRVLERHWPGVKRYGDIRDVDPAELEPVDLLCGGFPCQDLSMAGKRAGLAGRQSSLYWEFHRIASGLAPRWLLIENVPGLLSSHKGRDFRAILDSLVELGYGVAWRILDAQYFGLAQRRKRVFVVGHLGEPWSAPAKVLFEPESLPWYPPPRREAGKTVATLLASSAGTSRPAGIDSDRAGQRQEPTSDTFGDLCYTLDATSRHGVAVAPCLRSNPYNNSDAGMEAQMLVAHSLPARADSSEDGTGRGTPLVVHENISGHASPSTITRSLRSGASHSYQFVTDVFPTLRGFGHGWQGQHWDDAVKAMMVRRLTPLECERLQGFPDGWTAGETDSARYRMLGNAVAVPVAEWVGRRILEVDRQLRGQE